MNGDDHYHETVCRWNRPVGNCGVGIGADPPLAPGDQRRNHRDDLSTRREKRFLHDDTIRLVGSGGSLEYKGHDYYGIWFSKITDIYDFGYEGPNKDVLSADFTAMVGPAEEFGALGYTDVPAGGLFVKPGVGVLKRDEMNYNHSRPYVIANGGKWDVKTSRDSVEFTHTLSEPSINFGYVYTKVVRLTPGKPQMTISHVMRNTGSKPIVTNVYNHNFTTIDKLHTGPDVEITGRGR